MAGSCLNLEVEMNTAEQSRIKFEKLVLAGALKPATRTMKINGEYESALTKCAWLGWSAARDEIIKAIEEAGIKVVSK